MNGFMRSPFVRQGDNIMGTHSSRDESDTGRAATYVEIFGLSALVSRRKYGRGSSRRVMQVCR